MSASAESGSDPRLDRLVVLIEQDEQQGIPLQRIDYVVLAIVTVVVPALLLVIGAQT